MIFYSESSHIIQLLEEISNKLTEIHNTSVFSFNSVVQAKNADIDINIERLEKDLELMKIRRREYEREKREMDSGSC